MSFWRRRRYRLRQTLVVRCSSSAVLFTEAVREPYDSDGSRRVTSHAACFCILVVSVLVLKLFDGVLLRLCFNKREVAPSVPMPALVLISCIVRLFSAFPCAAFGPSWLKEQI